MEKGKRAVYILALTLLYAWARVRLMRCSTGSPVNPAPDDLAVRRKY